MPELDLPQRQATDTLMLTGFWYRALPADRVHRNQLHKATLLEIPLVIGRDRQGHPFALRDACPHRGMPLNCGNFDGENLECVYHGWQFDVHNGQCQSIPSLTSDQTLKIDRIYAGSYPCEERDYFIWVYIPDPGPSGAGFAKPEEAPDAAPQIEKFSDKYKLAYLQAEMPVSIDHGIIGLMDPAHGPFVHQAWWWRTQHSIHEKKKHFEPIPNGFRMSTHTPSSNSAPYKLLRLYANADSITTTIDFVLPNIRSETIRAGKYWFSSLTTVTPIARNQCRIDVVAAWNLFRWVPFVPDLCVEVLLDSDRAHDIDRRVKSYLEGGAREVIVVGQYGQVEYWGVRGRRQASDFGTALSLDRMYFEEGGVSNHVEHGR